MAARLAINRIRRREAGTIYGPVERIRERWRSDWEGLPFTGLTVRTEQEEAYALMSDLVGARDANPSRA